MSQRLRVLVADDSRDNANSLALVLRLLGHEVRVAFDGPSALAEAQGWLPDVVVLDLAMPGNGHELAKQLREHPGTRKALLVCVSGYDTQADRERSLAAGCHHLLVKPVELNEWRRLLDSVIPQEPAPRGRPGTIASHG